MKRHLYLVAAIVTASFCSSSTARAETAPWGIRPVDYHSVIERVVAMPNDSNLQQRSRALGLNVVNVMWEDTGRSSGSSIGPNISDVTLQVREQVDGGIRTHLLPVIRHPNFTDRTADVPADRIWVRVGNHRDGLEPGAVPLTEMLGNLRSFLSDPASIEGSDNFITRRDSHFLVSAQHVFMPIPRRGRVEFNPVIFNYQSAPDSPAVLVLLVTREGTSATIIENRSGDQSFQGWGQQLFHNNHGQRTVFTAERRSDVAARVEQGGTARPGDAGALEEGADMLLIVQVPLRHNNRGLLGGGMEGEAAMAAPPSVAMERHRGGSDVEQAVLGHGRDLGSFREMGGLRLRRDRRFPIRVTVQFYRATSNGVVSEQDLADVHRQIERVYEEGDFVGSLVVPENERHRPTDWYVRPRG